MAEAYPLAWPAGCARTPSQRIGRGRFKTGFVSARDGILQELRLMRAQYPVISSNVPLRRDGLPYAGMAQPADRGVAVYFTRNGKQLCISCDRWDRVEDNLHAINLTLEAMRGLDRWGCSDMLDRAFTGFAALPPPQETEHWSIVLGVHHTASLGAAEAAYRERMLRAHPDVGGSQAAAQRLNRAIEEARKEAGNG